MQNLLTRCRGFLAGATIASDVETSAQIEPGASVDGSRETGDRAETDGAESIRVALFTPALRYGGAQRVTVNIANGLAARGYTVDLVAGRFEGEFTSAVDDAVRVVDLGVPRVPGVGILAGIPHLRSYLRSDRPDVLLASRTHANMAAVVAAALADVDVHVAVTEHIVYGGVDGVDDRTGAKDRVMYAVAPRLYRFADDVVGVSEGVVESIVETTNLDADDTTVLYNPIDIESVQAEAEGAVEHEWLADSSLRTVVSVSRLEPQKDLSTLLEAFATVAASYPEARLICVGKGSERERLVSLARSLGVEDRVSFPGYVDNPYVFMKHADVYALSSRYEGLPTTLIEALACGCTVVATDCPHGPREILDGGEYGWLTPVGDETALAAAIDEAFTDPIPDDKSVNRAESFSVSTSISRYERYVRSAVEGSTRG